jgi:hypothetical protein
MMSALLMLTGCSTVFDYSVPTTKPDDRTKFSGITATATSLSEQYTGRAGNVASTSQVFDFVTAAGVAATVFATIFRASTPELEALTAGTATSYAFGSYYGTRVRATAYFNGAAAMNCVATLSGSADTLFSEQNQAAVRLVYSQADPNQRPTLNPVIDFPSHGAILLSSAIDSVNSKVLASAMTASPAPDISTLRSTMLSQVQDAVTKAQAFTTAAQPRGREASTVSIQPQIDFVANFDSAVTVCIAKAG